MYIWKICTFLAKNYDFLKINHRLLIFLTFYLTVGMYVLVHACINHKLTILKYKICANFIIFVFLTFSILLGYGKKFLIYSEKLSKISIYLMSYARKHIYIEFENPLNQRIHLKNIASSYQKKIMKKVLNIAQKFPKTLKTAE